MNLKLFLSICVLQALLPLTIKAFQIGLSNTIQNHLDDGENTFIDLPVSDCDEPSQLNYAKLIYLEMDPPCEKTNLEGYCGIRRKQNITLISKFFLKQTFEQLKVQVHLVDKNFGFETFLWPEFSACHPFFNLTCPDTDGLKHSYVYTELPREIPPANAIVRVRLLTVDDKRKKTLAICRQIRVHVM